MEEYLRAAAQIVSLVAEAAGIIIIAVAVVRGFLHHAVESIRNREPMPSISTRLSMGRSLALALEFLLAADIVRTAVAPSWEEIGKLAAIAAIRTGLNFFLEREIEKIDKQEGEAEGKK